MKPRPYTIGARTQGANHWHRSKPTDWQRERKHGPILPMEDQPKGWLARWFA